MDTKYAFKELKENMARALLKDLGISTKISIEIANLLRGKNLDTAKNFLEKVMKKERAIPFKRFTNGVGHRAGANIGAGRYPEKASKEFINLFKAVEANAQAKGLSSNLKIIHLVAHKGTNQFRGGRQSRRQFKRTHIEVVVEEQEEVKKKPEAKKEAAKPVEKKVEPKKEAPKAVEKKEVPKPVEKKVEEKKAEVKKETPKPVESKKEEKKLEPKIEEKKPVEKKPDVKIESPKKETKPEETQK